MILIDRLGPDYVSTVQMKEHVLHRARAHLKVLGCSVVTMLPMFLSRLNELMAVAKRFYQYRDHFEAIYSFLE